MDYTRRDRYSNRQRSPAKDITAPRRDPHARVSKPSHYDHRATSSRQQRANGQSFEDEQSKQWVAQEDMFVLKQAKKKAVIRVKEGRAKPIDWLAVILRMIDPDRDLLDDDEEEVQMDVVDPEGVFEGLNDSQLKTLENDITSYLNLETNKRNQDYWHTMQIICKDRRERLKPAGPEGRAVSSVSADVDRLLGPKTYDQLEALEKQIKAKLRSNEPIDTDYWEQLLRSLSIFKAKAKLKKVYQSVIEARLNTLRQQQKSEADAIRSKLELSITGSSNQDGETVSTDAKDKQPGWQYLASLDPDSLLKLKAEDKSLDILDESIFLSKVTSDRKRILRLGFVPSQSSTDRTAAGKASSELVKGSAGSQRLTTAGNEEHSLATNALYEREVARGVGEDEEVFAAEESVSNEIVPLWADKYRPRKPKYFNRVQMGYEWNKYNQTHYDHDNPPPKVVQGYKFNIFYPDLIDKTKAPTFKIIRENGRKKGESFAPAGEEDTCVIRFIAGPPYEDIAFRIVDKEWDYSAKRDRGFRSSFDKGILQLHFQYKKVYYRK